MVYALNTYRITTTQQEGTHIYLAYSQYMASTLITPEFRLLFIQFYRRVPDFTAPFGAWHVADALVHYYQWFYVIFWHFIYIIMVYDGCVMLLRQVSILGPSLHFLEGRKSLPRKT
jgi:hypothetical protein